MFMKLRPTLWRTCRVLANETRLQLLWLLFKEQELYVQQIAERTGMSISNASTQLRALSARGLIAPRRKNMMVFYRAEANSAVDAAPVLLDTLRVCREQGVLFKTMIRQATAFTHERRIEIIRALRGKALEFHELMETTGMSASALSRHLEKLEARGFVKYKRGFYQCATPGNPLGRTLLKIIAGSA
jgi:DNA-binding transcriptional ArsR family regulator